jgi:hypothetical protein
MEKMMKIVKFAIPCTIMIVSSYLAGSRVSDIQMKKQRVEIIKQNTEIIKSISGVAITQSAISDLLVRLSHYTDKHEGGNHMCPECSGREFEFDDIEEEEDEVEETHKQIMADLKEIESSIDSLTFGHLHQIQKMERMLEKERKKSELGNVDFFGGGVL